MRRRAFLIVLLATLVVAGACSKGGIKRVDGKITKGGSISVFDLKVGDCLLPDKDTTGEVEKLNAVPCKEKHTQEVFALPDYKGPGADVYPGEGEIRKFADAACLEAFEHYTGTDYLNSNLFFSYLHPSLTSWNDDKDRTIACLIVNTGNETTGSYRATTTTTIKGSKITTSTTVKKTTTTSTTVATTATTTTP